MLFSSIRTAINLIYFYLFENVQDNCVFPIFDLIFFNNLKNRRSANSTKFQRKLNFHYQNLVSYIAFDLFFFFQTYWQNRNIQLNGICIENEREKESTGTVDNDTYEKKKKHSQREQNMRRFYCFDIIHWAVIGMKQTIKSDI